MSGGVTGDFGALDATIGEIEQLAGVDARIARRAAARLQAVARAQYAAGVGPDGRAWPRTKEGHVALVGLASQVTFRAEGGAIVAEAPDELRYHMRTRPVLPAPSAPIPPVWQAAIDQAAADELGERGSQ
jgi:hypothetical protein